MAKTTKKPKKSDLNETEIVVVLDRSGSMGSIASATVEGFNKFLYEQQNSQGEAFITLVQFDDRYEMNYQSIPVKNASQLILGESFVPRGGTALFDAIGKTIEELKTNRDVVFVIITDGEENASKVYKQEAINKMIETLQKEDGWKFIFLAANQDAIKAGNSIGINGTNSMNYAATSAGASRAFSTVSSNMATYRSAKSAAYFTADLSEEMLDTTLYSKSLNFTDDQRNDQKKEEA
jgi:uncharacterized protein with von Willebrand factor type A (vWA) domain